MEGLNLAMKNACIKGLLMGLKILTSETLVSHLFNVKRQSSQDNGVIMIFVTSLGSSHVFMFLLELALHHWKKKLGTFTWLCHRFSSFQLLRGFGWCTYATLKHWEHVKRF